MKNDKAMNLTTATKLDLAIAEAQGKVTVKRLKTRGPRKGETHYTARTTAAGRGGVLGAVQPGDRAQGVACGKGNGGTITPRCGIGKEAVTNLDKVVATYKAVKTAEARTEARLRAAEKLDALLADLRG